MTLYAEPQYLHTALHMFAHLRDMEYQLRLAPRMFATSSEKQLIPNDDLPVSLSAK